MKIYLAPAAFFVLCLGCQVAPAQTPSPTPERQRLTPPPAAPDEAASTRISPWEDANVQLRRGEKYRSPSGKHYLVLQDDGNLVIYTAGNSYVWGLDRAKINLAAVKQVEMRNGNLLAKDATGKILWSALNPAREADARLRLTPEGALQIVSSPESILWSSSGAGTAGPAATAATATSSVGGSKASTPTASPAKFTPPATAATRTASKLPLTTGTTLTRGSQYVSPSGDYVLAYEPDGNLVVRTKGKDFVWGLNDVFADFGKGERVALQEDGNLAVLDVSGRTIWSAPATKRDPNAILTVSFPGVLQLVSPTQEVLWSSDGNTAPLVKVSQKPTNLEACTPETGWPKCRALAEPKITIYGSAKVSDAALDAVANVYTQMTKRFGPKYPKSTFDGFKVYITNGESAAELDKMEALRDFGSSPRKSESRDWLRGGANGSHIWIEEQMICKRGVKTRNAAFAAGKAKEGDNIARTYDQVVHEFAHAIAARYKLDQSRIQEVYKGDPMGPIEAFPWNVQYWFGAPGGQMTDKGKALMEELFTSQARFEPYQP